MLKNFEASINICRVKIEKSCMISFFKHGRVRYDKKNVLMHTINKSLHTNQIRKGITCSGIKILYLVSSDRVHFVSSFECHKVSTMFDLLCLSSSHN